MNGFKKLIRLFVQTRSLLQFLVNTVQKSKSCNSSLHCIIIDHKSEKQAYNDLYLAKKTKENSAILMKHILQFLLSKQTSNYFKKSYNLLNFFYFKGESIIISNWHRQVFTQRAMILHFSVILGLVSQKLHCFLRSREILATHNAS